MLGYMHGEQMQVKKEDVRDKIINSARKEFLKHGYLKASLRVIAENESLTKGAIYSYFKNKDALFCELTAPAVSFIENEFQNDKNCFSVGMSGAAKSAHELTIQSFKRCANSVLGNYESFKLLLFCSAGSSLQNYKERIIRLYAQNFYKIVSFFTEAECDVSVINEIFIHTLASSYVSFLEELILHKPGQKQADDYAAQLAVFVQAGMKKLYFHQMQ